MPNNTILITGAAGFIGFHVAQQLLSNGREVVGVDSVNDYYNPKLKEARLELLKRNPKFSFVKLDLADRAASKSLFEHHRFPIVIHLAAQAGVRYSLQNPHAYVDANIEGFINVLEGCRHNGCRHLVFASSSSVYGANTKLPFSVRDNVDHPISLYAGEVGNFVDEGDLGRQELGQSHRLLDLHAGPGFGGSMFSEGYARPDQDGEGR